ncbi:hypothetical protein [Candidatus Alistipes pullistercoris]|uniref:hypothetical protein n=1 Tax=Candidatus Alistipes pullistercoris TaxID=2838446 RepID=UPI0022E5FFD7|nr:hypothetical protein [Candidatus Alistipes pullistercoris]
MLWAFLITPPSTKKMARLWMLDAQVVPGLAVDCVAYVPGALSKPSVIFTAPVAPSSTPPA